MARTFGNAYASKRIGTFMLTHLVVGLPCLLVASAAFGQVNTSPIKLPDTYKGVDEQGFELAYGGFRYQQELMHIGPPGAGGFGYGLYWNGGLDFEIPQSGNVHVALDPYFDNPDSVNINGETKVVPGNGRSLTCGGTIYDPSSGDPIDCLFIDKDGTKITFRGKDYQGRSLPRSIYYPNGLIVNYFYENYTQGDIRLISIENNLGYQIRFKYSTITSNISNNTLDLSSVHVVNSAIAYCDPHLSLCTEETDWPSVDLSMTNLNNSNNVDAPIYLRTVKDPNGGLWKFYTGLAGRLFKIVRPNETESHVEVVYETYDALHPTSNQLSGIPSRITTDGKAVNYSVSADGLGRNVQYSDGRNRSYGIFTVGKYDYTGVFDEVRRPSRLGSVTDELGRSTVFGHDFTPRLTSVTNPDGNSVEYLYDDRSNMIRETRHARPGSGLADIVSTAIYPTGCTTGINCNKPISYTDGNGNQTDWTYDPTHGQVLTETGPAVNGIRPQKRYSYVYRYAWLKNASGGYSKTDSGIWLLGSTRSCRSSAWTGSACAAGTADEVVTTYDYGPGGSGPNNLWLRGIAVTADGVTRRTCYGYDRLGRKISETAANANLAVCP